MKRSEVREFLRHGVNALLPVPEFGSGLITDFNYISSKQADFPKVWQVITPVSVVEGNSAPTESWNIELLICRLDRMDSSPAQYEAIIDECDEMARKLHYKYRNIVDGYKLVTMEGINREPFIKKHAACLTGVTLSFTLIAPNTSSDVC